MIKVNLQKVRELRKEQGLSQEDVAKVLGFKTVYPYHRKESGQQAFTAEELKTLAQMYKVSYKIFLSLKLQKIKLIKKNQPKHVTYRSLTTE